MEIKTNLIAVNTKRRSGKKIENVGFITLHDTGNDGSTAKNNVDYFIKSANDMSASAHLFVDDKECIMCIPAFENAEKAWHVLYETTEDNKLFGDDANDISIGVEGCYFSKDIERTKKSYANYVDVVVQLIKFHGLKPNDISPHFRLDPNRKTDPANMLKVIGKTYTDLQVDIIRKYESSIKKDWKQIIRENTSSPDKWIKGIDAIKNMAELPSDLEDLEIFKFIDELIEKIGNK